MDIYPYPVDCFKQTKTPVIVGGYAVGVVDSVDYVNKQIKQTGAKLNPAQYREAVSNASLQLNKAFEETKNLQWGLLEEVQIPSATVFEPLESGPGDDIVFLPDRSGDTVAYRPSRTTPFGFERDEGPIDYSGGRAPVDPAIIEVGGVMPPPPSAEELILRRLEIESGADRFIEGDEPPVTEEEQLQQLEIEAGLREAPDAGEFDPDEPEEGEMPRAFIGSEPLFTGLPVQAGKMDQPMMGVPVEGRGGRFFEGKSIVYGSGTEPAPKKRLDEDL